MTDRATKERGLIALMLTDLELELTDPEMLVLQQEVRDLPEEELDRTLASRLEISYPVDDAEMEQALGGIEYPSMLHGVQTGGVSGTTNARQQPLRPGEPED